METKIQGQLAGRVALVTGASSGIGRAAAIELARRGAKLVVAARRQPELDSLVAEIAAAGGEARAFVADIAQEAEVRALVDFAAGTYGRLDIAFNNAGTEGSFAPLVEQTAERYQQVFDLNVRGVLNSMRYEAELMLAQGGGSIINNASMGGVIGFENASVYIASKHAVVGLTKTAAVEYAKDAIRINSLCPGAVKTPMLARMLEREPGRDKKLKVAHPMGRIADASEVANAALWLCSEQASFVTGHQLAIDGGLTAI